MPASPTERLDRIVRGGVPPIEVANIVRDYTAQHGAEALRDYVNHSKLTGAQIAALTPGGLGAHGLSLGQNLRALGGQTKQLFADGVDKVPGRVARAVWNTTGNTGFGAAGVGPRARYLPLGTRLGLLMTMLPEAATAAKAEDVTGAGRSRTERIGHILGGIAGNIGTHIPGSVMNRFGAGGFLAHGLIGHYGQTLGSTIGARVGRELDKGVSDIMGNAAGDITNRTLRRGRMSSGAA